MPSLDTFITFSLACVLISLSPGPSNLYIMARSLSQGAQAGMAAAAGLAIGSVLYILVTALGLAAIFVYTPIAYTALKLAGGVYLIYLGWQTFRNASAKMNVDTQSNGFSRQHIFRQSIIVELTNPKTALFFLAFLPQFTHEGAPLAPQLLILGGLYALIALACDMGVALLSGKIGHWLNQHPSFPYWQDKVSGGILCGLGLYLAATELYQDDRPLQEKS